MANFYGADHMEDPETGTVLDADTSDDVLKVEHDEKFGTYDEMYGQTGNDNLGSDKAGAVYIEGGDGNDNASVTNAMSMGILTAYGGEGNDLLLGGDLGADQLFGDTGDDWLSAGDAVLDVGADYLDGGEGRDAVFGYGGNDTLYGGEGDESGAAITVGKFDQKPTPGIYGGNGNDYLDGQGGNDFIDGGTGADFMVGGFGNDTFIADNSGNSAFEGAGGGFDTVIASASFSLSAASDVEQILTSDANLTTALNLTGSSIANTITGNAGVNTLKGAAGNDILTALAGNDILDGGLDKDQLFGGDGNDKLFGNAGSDKLTGGKGKDTFVFNTAPDKSTNVDKILDFKSVDDTIQIDNKYFKTVGGNGKLKAEVLAFGKKALEKDDHLIYDKSTGNLSYDADGIGKTAAIKIAILSNKAVLKVSDFFVI